MSGRWSRTTARVRVVVLGLFLSIGLGAAGGALAETPLARAVAHEGGVRFATEGSEVPWRLTVAGPDGFYRSERVEAGKDFVLRFAGSESEAAPEGVYTWEVRAAGGHVSGHFRLNGGAVGLPDAALTAEPGPVASLSSSLGEEPAPAFGGVVIHPDDVFVQGQMCIGGDCQGTEPLGLEVVRLKQNNTWIFFEDTSAAANFATNDWQIRVNDSFSFGFDYFSIEDITGSTVPFTIEAGAASDSLWIDEVGRVGLGTATPSEQLHVTGNAVVSGDFSVLSSRAAKTGFAPIDGSELMERLASLPLAEWSYLDGEAARHLGPTAEDFHSAFALGRDRRYVHPLDLAGVALAAAQELDRRLREEARSAARELEKRDLEIARLARDRDRLQARLEALERRLAELDGGASPR